MESLVGQFPTTQELATRLKNGQDVGVSSTERQPSLMMPFRVVALHLHAFYHRQLWQMPNEEYQFPVVLRSMGGAKFSNFNDGFTDAGPCNQLNLFDF